MKLDFSKCETAEDVDAVMKKGTSQIRMVQEAFDKVFSGRVTGRMTSKEARMQNIPRTLKKKGK